MLQKLKPEGPFFLESGKQLPEIEIAFHTYGKLNPERDNVIWICHALTADADVANWWSGMVGEGKCFDWDKHFIVCANILGSCYGTTGPLSKDENGDVYYGHFPDVTIRDMVKAHIALRKHLGISKIKVLNKSSYRWFYRKLSGSGMGYYGTGSDKTFDNDCRRSPGYFLDGRTE